MLKNIFAIFSQSLRNIKENISLASGYHLVLPSNNEEVTPTLAFGDGDTGFFESSDDVLFVSFGGGWKYSWSSSNFRSRTTFSFYLSTEGSSAASPVYCFYTDEDTGLGHAAADQLSLIAGGVEGQRVIEANSVIYNLFGVTEQDSVTDATTNGTTTITKAGENFLTTCAIGDIVLIWSGTTTADYGLYRVKAVTDDTNLVLDSAPSGSDSDVDFYVLRNGMIITAADGLVMSGTTKRWLTLRAEMDYTAQIAASKPTQVSIGVAKGFSMPIYSADNEELFFRETVPDRWDGVSDIIFHIKVALAAGEDVDDYFKFQLSWEHAVAGEPVPATSNDVEVEQAVLTGRNAQYDEYDVFFTIDHDIDGAGNEIQPHELLAARLRRIDATNPDITNEVIILNWHTHYQIDKMAAGS